MKSFFATIFLAAVLCLSSKGWAETVKIASPDESLVGSLQIVDGVPQWEVAKNGEPMLLAGRLGLSVGPQPIGKLVHKSAQQSSMDELVRPKWGQFSQYRNHFNQLTWTLTEPGDDGRTLVIEVRAFNDAIAVRYRLPAEGNWPAQIKLLDDSTEFCFAEDATGWCYAGEYDPLGPQSLSKFRKSKNVAARLPLTVQFSSGRSAAVMEAAISQIAPIDLTASKTGDYAFRATFKDSIIRAGDATSWRVFLVGNTPGDLIVSPVLECLNPPCQIQDPDWIVPGLAMWDWRAWGATTEDGFTYGLDMPSWRRFIDFAGEYGVRYLVLDAGWYGLEFDAKSDPRTSRPYLLVQPDPQNPKLVPQQPPANWEDPTDVAELIRYAKKKDVGIILYFNDIARLNYPFDETLALYQKWGAAGIKYGFMKGDGQRKVLDTRTIVQKCAEHHLLCDFHDGPVPPSGDVRTFPNYVTREFCHSQSDAKRAFSPSAFCEQMFVNQLAGPLDMCNGLYTLENPARDRPKVFVNIDTTVVAETARVMICFSGLSILPDCPEAYLAKADLFEFLGKLPMTWDETRILHGRIGEFITTARRDGDDWFIASATDEQGRTLSLKLDFLQPDKIYTATLYEDAEDAHFQTNREAYQVRKIRVRRGDSIDAKMAPGGGHCVFVTPAE
ncbi:Retaining alpha-galactosidase precursor [Planctomycetes bacterium CA13]|uniref:Retaining alpha-galactosidase n=1 Tax=Novipirellula herctigrandis TaxID=2527986 RepID=A0A5C5YN47_9BACT|nr:Retaining alpha-galactosidase precursor [Planctomycetes bacterium CA13]